jgi:DNA-directed RNA polymerase specialized sigma24 family protein
MDKFVRNGSVGFRLGAVPPFWLDSNGDGTSPIDPRVLQVAEQNWSWAYWLIQRELHDEGRAAEIVEKVANEVSSRLIVDTEVGRNLGGYFRTAVIRRVRTVAARDQRITYCGGTQDLEASHRPSTPDLTKVFEDRSRIDALLPFLAHPIRRILNLRLLDYSWKEVSQQLGLTEKQAKSRFYHGLRQAADELLADRDRKAQKREAANGNV